MRSEDPLDTQRYPPSPAAELADLGFTEATEIGHGGFGVVYRCNESELERLVAVKVLTVELDQENKSRFFREQQAMGQLTGHPNIVNVLQVGSTDSGRLFIVMPYHQLDSLESRIRRDGPLPLDEALRLGVKIAGAVETAHGLGILHRDIKPANILLSDYGEPELADFGIAHISGGFETTSGAVTGSPAYTAPEVLAGNPPTVAADVYSLGATLFSALTGHAAFERRSGEQVVAQFLRITQQSIPDLREHGIPDDVSSVVARAMSRAPDDRPRTASEFGEELRQVQHDLGFPMDDMALREEHRSETDAKADASSARSKGSARPRPPSGLGGATGNLPLELTSFIGRRSELTAAKNLLSSSRLVTLTGIGGVGKTRLAVRVASSVQRDFADGVRLVEMAELRGMSALVDAVAAAVGVRGQSARSMREVLTDVLSRKELLLLLDNCEHMVSEAAELCQELLTVCPGLKILATSREALGIAGESILRVPPLKVPDPSSHPSLRAVPRYDAASLFVERAASAAPGFALTEDNIEAVLGICRRLDGLPLAIELAAARLRMMSPEQILQRLTDRYTLLTRGSRGAPDRQQTLRLSINWSYDLCTASEKLVWGRLAVFAGSFDLDAAEQVCSTGMSPDELLDTLTALADKSILIRDKNGSAMRFRMLETLREYGFEKLERTGETLIMRRRHRDWFESLATDAEDDWISPRQLDWIARLKQEQPNFREALEFDIDDDPGSGLRTATALYWFWLSQGSYSEAREWLTRLLERMTGKPTVEWVKALYCAGAMANVQDDVGAGVELADKARALAADKDDPMMQALVANADGTVALHSGDIARASSFFEKSAPLFRRIGHRTLETATMHLLGLAYGLNGQTRKAIEWHEQVLALTAEQDEKMYRSRSLWAMAVDVWRQGESDRAVRLLEEALGATRLLRNPRMTASSLAALAWITLGQNDPTRTAVLLGAADGVARSFGSSPVIHPNLMVFQDMCTRGAREQLGKAFDAEYRRGTQLGMDEAIAYALRERPSGATKPDATASERLTKREREVAALVTEGLTNQAIADRLVISPRTAQGHVEHILAKLGFTSRAQVAAWVADQTHE
ncbi:protein kinase [Rhodococcus sp. BP-252]|uniref:Protein kinase n=1 Tax=Rhodococcoides kyotonense TaxID=398843 RepID=A0A177YH81_9NOCA|nr:MULTISPECIES: protein kinase [Rhodococcus]MBY6412304.1 protein kinase [Rhodococcus sp. BP-320]MBY6416884.1 protein kinase [Rhodococcus sp. BP-321]MBY6421578.1 protein kinase [Rhodococcus sp. BP-324]MBY6426844.1 protein kinase [Rhodococcus sp. BP-323]MBY6432010.1 protein kinase [Rhodococcus sp. BP-322]